MFCITKNLKQLIKLNNFFEYNDSPRKINKIKKILSTGGNCVKSYKDKNNYVVKNDKICKNGGKVKY